MKLKVTLACLLFFSFGCLKKDILGDQTTDSIEAGISTFGDIADEEVDEDFARNYNSPLINFLDGLKIQSSYAADCAARAGQSQCLTGVRSVNYNNCTIPGTSQLLNGSISLNYSNQSCALTNNGNSVTRTYDFTRTTSWGATITTTSDPQVDYTGESYGGGGILTKTSTGYSMVLNGKHKTRTTGGGKPAFDLSLKTTSPIELSALDRSIRTVDGGRLQITNNLKKYTIALEPNSLTYSSGCCYPTGGTIDVTISGKVNATGTVSFNSCGNATVSKNGINVDVSLASCE